MSLKRLWIWVGNVIGALAALTVTVLACFDPEFRTASGEAIRALLWEAAAASENVDRWLRWRLRAVFVSPFAVFVLAYYLPREDALIWIPIFLLIPILALVLVGTERTSWTVGVALLPLGRKTILTFTSLMVVAIAAGTLFAAIPVANDRHLIPLFFLLLVLLAIPAGNNSGVRTIKVAAAIGVIALIVIFFLGGRTKALTKGKEIGATIPSYAESLFTASGKSQPAGMLSSRLAERASYQPPAHPLIPSPGTFMPPSDPNTPCPGMQNQVEDYNRQFELQPAPAGSMFSVVARGDRLFPAPCFGQVIRLPDEFARRGGYCTEPCTWNGEGCDVEDPDHRFVMWIQFVTQDAYGNWIPAKTVGPIRWTNLKADNPYILNPPNPLVLRLRGLHAPHGGVAFIPIPPGGCPEPDYPPQQGAGPNQSSAS